MADLESVGTLTRAQLEMLACVANGEDEQRPRTLDELPRLLGRYQIREPIGSGGMGFVFKGWDVRLQTHVAIKLARPTRSGDSNLQARLLREARSAAAIHHQCVVGIRDIGEAEDGSPFVVMDYLDGEPLSAILAARGRLPWAEAVSLLDQISSGLQAAHESGIVHRDLKPSNVFVSEHADGTHCTLIDFGLARVLDLDEETRGLTRDGQLVGTPRYMSPEQIRGDAPVGPRADVYALGCLAFHLLSGAPPFRGRLHQLLHKHLHETPPRLDDVPVSIADVVARCLAKKSDDRPMSAAVVREALVLSMVKLEAPRRVRRGFRTLAVLASLGLGGIVGWSLHGSQPPTAVQEYRQPAASTEVTPVRSDATVAQPLRAGPERDEEPLADPVGLELAIDATGSSAPMGSLDTAAPEEEAASPKPTTRSRRRRTKSTSATQPSKKARDALQRPAPETEAAEHHRTREEILQELDGLH